MDNRKFTPIEVYQLRLKDEIKRFPPRFWNIENANIIIRYLIEEVLKWNDGNYHKVTKEIFRKNKLGGMLRTLFKDSANKAIYSVYLNRFNTLYTNSFNNKDKNIEVKVSKNMLESWKNEEDIKLIIRKLIEEKYHWTREEVIKNYNYKLLVENGLEGICNYYTLYQALNLTYPGIYLKWDFVVYWHEEDYFEAIKWLIETKLQWSKEEIITSLTVRVFIKNGLQSVVPIRFKNAYEAMCFAYPEENWDKLKERVYRTKRKVVPRCRECNLCLKHGIEKKAKYFCGDLNDNNKRIFQKKFMKNSPKWCPKR